MKRSMLRAASAVGSALFLLASEAVAIADPPSPAVPGSGGPPAPIIATAAPTSVAPGPAILRSDLHSHQLIAANAGSVSIHGTSFDLATIQLTISPGSKDFVVKFSVLDDATKAAIEKLEANAGKVTFSAGPQTIGLDGVVIEHVGTAAALTFSCQSKSGSIDTTLSGGSTHFAIVSGRPDGSSSLASTAKGSPDITGPTFALNGGATLPLLSESITNQMHAGIGTFGSTVTGHASTTPASLSKATLSFDALNGTSLAGDAFAGTMINAATVTTSDAIYDLSHVSVGKFAESFTSAKTTQTIDLAFANVVARTSGPQDTAQLKALSATIGSGKPFAVADAKITMDESEGVTSGADAGMASVHHRKIVVDAVGAGPSAAELQMGSSVELTLTSVDLTVKIEKARLTGVTQNAAGASNLTTLTYSFETLNASARGPGGPAPDESVAFDATVVPIAGTVPQPAPAATSKPINPDAMLPPLTYRFNTVAALPDLVDLMSKGKRFTNVVVTAKPSYNLKDARIKSLTLTITNSGDHFADAIVIARQ